MARWPHSHWNPIIVFPNLGCPMSIQFFVSPSDIRLGLLGPGKVGHCLPHTHILDFMVWQSSPNLRERECWPGDSGDSGTQWVHPQTPDDITAPTTTSAWLSRVPVTALIVILSSQSWGHHNRRGFSHCCLSLEFWTFPFPLWQWPSVQPSEWGDMWGSARLLPS